MVTSKNRLHKGKLSSLSLLFIIIMKPSPSRKFSFDPFQKNHISLKMFQGNFTVIGALLSLSLLLEVL